MICYDCDGSGEVEVEYEKSHSSSRDVGEIFVEIETCLTCYGSGKLQDEDEDEQNEYKLGKP